MSQTAVAPIPPRPTMTQSLPVEQVKKIEDLLKHPAMIDRFKQAMPRHLSSERMLRVCMLAVNKTPKLGECDIWSLTGAMLSLASLGLEPNTTLGHAYLIPFEKKKRSGNEWVVERVDCQVVIGYRGLIDLARRSGNLVSLHADVVYEGDEFPFEYGSNMHLKHVPMGKRDRPIWAYAHAKLTDGEAFEVLPYNLVLDIRNNSQGYQAAAKALKDSQASQKDAWKRKSHDETPWVKHEHEMAAKTMIRRIAKVLPMSIEFMTAVELDTKNDSMMFDYGAVARMPEPTLIMDQVATVLEDEGENASQPSGSAAEPAQEETPPKDAKPAEAARQPRERQPEPETSQAKDEPAAAFTIVTAPDGQVLQYDDYGDFRADLQKEMKAAAKHGRASLEGFMESNAAVIAELEPQDAEATKTNHAALLKALPASNGERLA